MPVVSNDFIRQIRDIEMIEHYNPIGADWSSCPICRHNVHYYNGDYSLAIVHAEDCAYIAAQGIELDD